MQDDASILNPAQEAEVERIVATFFVRVLEVYAEGGDEIARNALERMDAAHAVRQAEDATRAAAQENRTETLLRRARFPHGPPPDDAA